MPKTRFKVLCPDKRHRLFRVSRFGEELTGRVNVSRNGVPITVTGTVHMDGNEYIFHPVGKNKDIFKK